MNNPAYFRKDSACEFGVPTELESYQHQCLMLLDELQEAWSDIRRLKADSRTLIAMNDGLKAELKALKTLAKIAINRE